MESKQVTKTILTTSSMLSHNDMHDDLIGLVFDFVGNIWESCDEVDHHKCLYKLTNFQPSAPRWEDRHYCDVCQETFRCLTDTTMQNHFNTKKHRNKLKRCKTSSDTDEVKRRVLKMFTKRYPRWRFTDVVLTPLNYQLKKVVHSEYVYIKE